MAVAPGLQVGRLQPSVGGGLGDAGVLGQGADAPMGGMGGMGGGCNGVLGAWATRWPSWVGPGRCSSCSPARPWWCKRRRQLPTVWLSPTLGTLQMGLSLTTGQSPGGA